MAIDDDHVEPAARAKILAKLLLESGLPQTEVARKVGVKPQYLCDVKKGRKPLTDSFAYQLGRTMGREWQECLGTSPVAGQLLGKASTGNASSLSLPVLFEPTVGSPRDSRSWDGSTVEVSGAAAVLAEHAHLPYVLRVPSPCCDERLRPGDLVLIDQSPSGQDDYLLAGDDDGITLVKRTGKGLVDVTSGKLMNEEMPPLGRVVAILLGRL